MKTAKVLALLASLTTAAQLAYAGEFVLQSNDIADGQTLPLKQVYSGCGGDNVSPELHWSGAPGATRSYALTVYDPDAPTGSGWWHWQIFNIPAGVSSLPADAGNPATGKAPAGSIQSRNDFGESGYGGACPPKGDKPHRYQFSLYALDTEKLKLPENASAAMVGFNIRAHALSEARLQALYAR